MRLLALAIIVGILGTAREIPAVSSNLLHRVKQELERHLQQDRFAAAQWGIQVVDVEQGEVWFEHQADKLMKPASTAKLYTGALALDLLGPDHRIATSMYAAQPPSETGILSGDLIVFGRGDPSFSRRFHPERGEDLLAPLAEALVQAGVRVIRGDLVGDERYFRGPPYGKSWVWEDLQYYYGAELSSLTVQDNVVDITIGPALTAGMPCRVTTWPATTPLTWRNQTITVTNREVRAIDMYRSLGQNQILLSGKLSLGARPVEKAATVDRPAQWFLLLLREALQRRGIQVQGNLRAVNWGDTYPVDYTRLVNLGHVYSPPLGEIVGAMMKPSQNLYAQLLWLQAGAASPDSSDPETAPHTEALGRQAMERFLGELKISRNEVYLEEGSGLSRNSLVTARATVGLLRGMWTHAHRENFLESLPAAGREGTMSQRLGDELVRGKVRAKTGTLSHVSALSGYLPHQTGHTLAFAVMLNQFGGGSYAARAAVDEVVMILARAREPQSQPDPDSGKASATSSGAESEAGLDGAVEGESDPESGLKLESVRL